MISPKQFHGKTSLDQTSQSQLTRGVLLQIHQTNFEWSSSTPAIVCSPGSSMLHTAIGFDLAERLSPSTSLGRLEATLHWTATRPIEDRGFRGADRVGIDFFPICQGCVLRDKLIKINHGHSATTRHIFNGPPLLFILNNLLLVAARLGFSVRDKRLQPFASKRAHRRRKRGAIWEVLSAGTWKRWSRRSGSSGCCVSSSGFRSHFFFTLLQLFLYLYDNALPRLVVAALIFSFFPYLLFTLQK